MYFVPFWLHNQNKVKFEYLVSLVNGTINYGTFRFLVSSWNNRRNQSIFLSFFSLAFLLFFFSIFTLFTPLLPLSLSFFYLLSSPLFLLWMVLFLHTQHKANGDLTTTHLILWIESQPIKSTLRTFMFQRSKGNLKEAVFWDNF